MLTSDTKRRIDSCRDILVGKLPLPTDQVELITLALIYKFMDDLDEESVAMGGRRSFFTGPLAPYRWRELMRQTVSADERMTRFADGLELLGGSKKIRLPKKNPKRGAEPTEEVDVAAHLPALFRDIFRNAFLKFRDGRILTLFLTELGGFAYSHSEELGNAFEYILSVMGAQGDNGQFRTPRHIIDFMVACLDPQPGDRVLDPACGTGGFLVSAFKHVLQRHTSAGSALRGDQLSHARRQALYGHFTGYDINDQMVKLSRVNLFLHDFATPTIHIYDTLTNDARWSEKYDLILANPPFMTPKGGVVPHTKFRVPAKKSEVLFTDYIAEHLTPDGRAGIIVPNGIVATTQTAYVKLRRFLVEDCLVAVISLPAGCFKPYSGVKTSILLLDKKLARKTDQILFLKIAADGFDLGDKRTPIEANDLPEAQRIVSAWLTGKLVADHASPLAWRFVEKRELLTKSDTVLTAERFTSDLVEVTGAPRVRLGDICERIMDGTHFSPKNSAQGQFRYITAKNIKEMRLALDEVTYLSREDHEAIYKRCPVKKGDVLYIKDGATTGVATINTLDEEFSLLSSVAVLRGKPEVLDNCYLAYYLNSSHGRSHMLGMVAGVAITRLTLTKLNDAEIPLPPLEEQQRIVAKIEGYQQVIDGARQILVAWDPQLTIDPEWPVIPLGEACDMKRGRFSHRPRNDPRFYNGKYPFIQTGDVARSKGGPVSHTQTLNEEGLAVSKLFQPPVVLITIAANIGETGILTYPACFPDSVVGLTPKPGVLALYLELAMRGKKVELDRMAPQMAQKNINIEILESVRISLPPLPEQERIVAELQAEAARIEAVRGLIPAFEAKIQRVLDRVWSNG